MDPAPTDACSTFLGLTEADDCPRPGRAVVLPIGYEKTVSYETGTRHAPNAVLNASAQVELYDHEFACEPVRRYGIDTLPALELNELPPGEAVERIADAVSNAAQPDRLPVVLGGEHTITVGVMRGLAKVFGNPVTLVQIDAHADLRDSYEDEPYSHACMARRVFGDEWGDIVQIGVRSLCDEEAKFIGEHRDRLRTIFADELHDDFRGCLAELYSGLEDRPVHLSIDVDGLDPSIVPATGTPEPDGMTWRQTLDVVRTVCSAGKVIGIDCVELAPRPGLHAADFTVAKLLYKTITHALTGAQG